MFQTSFIRTEYIEDTIRRCADIEPEEFKIILNKLIDENRSEVTTSLVKGSVPYYDAGSWNWYISRISQYTGKVVTIKGVLEFAGFEWEALKIDTEQEGDENSEDSKAES